MPVDLSNLVMNIGRRSSQDGGSDVVDIITFVESAWGLGMKLYPVQRVILKAHYGLELDDNPEGFDLEKPIPLDHPKYRDMIDYEPHPATNKIEVVDLDRISDHEAIGLMVADGTDYVLQRGDHWDVTGTPVDTLESIADAINLHASPDFKAEVHYGTNELVITSGAFSSEGNEARLELSTAKGLRISYPPTQEAQVGYAPDAHNFYGGGGGYYKNRIVVTDFRRENARVMTEAGYLKYLYDDGRCNIAEVIPGKQRREMVLSVGRRSGKTLITSCIVAYETYKLLVKGNPQKYYGASQSGVIQLISVATDKDQAGLLYREASGHFSKCDFFKPYAANATQSFATFQTPYDIENYGSYKENPKARYSINVTFRSCVAKGLRGGANILVALDEVAHFGDKGQASADEVYQAVEPSTRTFSQKDAETGRPLGENEGRIIMISSPLGKQGLFYKQFMLGFGNNKAADNLLCIQAPTWEVNPTVPAETFVGSYLKDPRVFETEFGAIFTDRTRGWIEDHKDLFACIDPKLRPKKRAPSRMPHFMGLDYALVGDYCAAVIGHTEPNGQVVVDLVDRIRAGEGDYAHLERLSVDDIADWIEDLCSRFYIAKGLSDQAFGIVVQQELQKRGLSQIEYIKHPKTLTSQMFANFKDLMYDEKVTLYDWPRPKDDPEAHSPFITELLELQATMHSKHVITVEAPQVEGKHDDMADALVRMTWLALNHKSKYVGFATGNHSVGAMQTGRAVARARMAARRGGSHPSRQIPRGGSGGTGRW